MHNPEKNTSRKKYILDLSAEMQPKNTCIPHNCPEKLLLNFMYSDVTLCMYGSANNDLSRNFAAHLQDLSCKPCLALSCLILLLLTSFFSALNWFMALAASQAIKDPFVWVMGSQRLVTF